MNDLILKIKNALDVPVFCRMTTHTGECVLWDWWTTLQMNSCEKVRLQITIIGDTTESTLANAEKIKSAILTTGDEPFNEEIFQVALNGGGTLYDEARQMQHRYLYFDIIKRGVL